MFFLLSALPGFGLGFVHTYSGDLKCWFWCFPHWVFFFSFFFSGLPCGNDWSVSRQLRERRLYFFTAVYRIPWRGKEIYGSLVEGWEISLSLSLLFWFFWSSEIRPRIALGEFGAINIKKDLLHDRQCLNAVVLFSLALYWGLHSDWLLDIFEVMSVTCFGVRRTMLINASSYAGVALVPTNLYTIYVGDCIFLWWDIGSCVEKTVCFFKIRWR